ncbi:RNase adapter RapZ [Actibacterium pelagium]|uniref:Nucleotide-binding protein n=1 Tax=Actibacterium pelagium TaxID=2029103 RepID=A0A917EKS7_9RHOB|nr:RNase adapter RapZ [Actibacterium pelagium]GGE48969.1 nucleotide-binding protein [Actibacterium pelagium]
MSDTAQPKDSHHAVFVTGPSGAGRSTALNALEDLGFEVIDNLPLSLIPRLIDGPPLGRPIALGVDSRNRDFSTENLRDLISQVRSKQDFQVEVLYLDCSDDVLIRRFSETRRRHPLAPAESAAEGVARDHDLMRPIKALADILIDTTDTTIHDLRADLAHLFGSVQGMSRLAVSVHSFSYKRGIPRGADMVFDCRFLRNPYWNPDLRGMSGLDEAVAEYVSADSRFDAFFTQVHDLVLMLLPAFREEGKSHISIAFGCTGGQHRSVTLAEKLTNALAEKGWQVSKRHRELERRANLPGAEKTG